MMTVSTDRARGPGRPRNKPSEVTSQLAIRLTAADRQALQELAEADGMPISTYIVSVLRRHLLDDEAS